MMKNLTSKLIGTGLVLGVILLGGCATNYEKIERQQKMQKYGVREANFSEDGLGAYISPFGFRHIEE